MFVRITMVVKVLAAALRILLLPFLPPQMVYTFSVFVSTWTFTLLLTYFYPRINLGDPTLFI
jgi:hypothetical protein